MIHASSRRGEFIDLCCLLLVLLVVIEESLILAIMIADAGGKRTNNSLAGLALHPFISWSCWCSCSSSRILRGMRSAMLAFFLFSNVEDTADDLTGLLVHRSIVRNVDRCSSTPWALKCGELLRYILCPFSCSERGRCLV